MRDNQLVISHSPCDAGCFSSGVATCANSSSKEFGQGLYSDFMHREIEKSVRRSNSRILIKRAQRRDGASATMVVATKVAPMWPYALAFPKTSPCLLICPFLFLSFFFPLPAPPHSTRNAAKTPRG